MIMNITRRDIDLAKADGSDVWAFGNGILYKLCRDYPEHKKPDVVGAKIWLIGRSYAAAVERRRNVDADNPIANDAFYKNVVIPKIIESKLDAKLDSLQPFSKIDEHSIIPVLEVHRYFVELLYEITELNKRSLASKYLHFHKPQLFYIYDSIASAGLSKVMPKYRLRKSSSNGKFDSAYSGFAFRLLELQKEIEQKYGEHLNPRQLDRMLLRLGTKK
jgi:hypothetical protein